MLNGLWLSFFLLGAAAALARWLIGGDATVFGAMVESLFAMAKLSVELMVVLFGTLTLWLGLLRIAEKAGLDGRAVAAAKADHAAIRRRIESVLGAGDVLAIPTSPRGAPLKNTPIDDIEIRFRNQAMHLLCIAGLGGLPQISLPIAEIDGLPLGLSLIGPRGADMQLLALARRLSA